MTSARDISEMLDFMFNVVCDRARNRHSYPEAVTTANLSLHTKLYILSCFAGISALPLSGIETPSLLTALLQTATKNLKPYQRLKLD